MYADIDSLFEKDQTQTICGKMKIKNMLIYLIRVEQIRYMSPNHHVLNQIGRTEPIGMNPKRCHFNKTTQDT